MQTFDKAILQAYKAEVNKELSDILSYWINHTFDKQNGGFVGQINELNIADFNAPKGAVLNSRILWSFSAAFQQTNNQQHFYLATTAFTYIKNHFVDKIYGGVYWSVNANGSPLETKKQIYALAFAMYGCVAYYSISNNQEAKQLAIQLFNDIEKHSYDSSLGGYFEAFTQNWAPLQDVRLSEKDANDQKTMNTHLHILEAYTVLYKIWPNDALKIKLENLVNCFLEHFIDSNTYSLRLFFTDTWQSTSTLISYGHDIEAAWLLLEAATSLQNKSIIQQVTAIAIKISTTALKGVDVDGGMWYEYEPATQHIIKEKHWWVQAEAMVGFFNAWQISNQQQFLDASIASWNYVKSYIKDAQYGEWYWGRNEQGFIMPNQDKVGLWKCPYHNTRACVELISRINILLQQS